MQQKSDEYLKLYTCDPGQASYHYWFLASRDVAVDAPEQWNEEEKSFVWTSAVGPGLTTTVTHRIVDDDTIALTVIVKDHLGCACFRSDRRSRRVERVGGEWLVVGSEQRAVN